MTERILMPRRNFEVNNDFIQHFRLSLQTVDYLDQRIGAEIMHYLRKSKYAQLGDFLRHIAAIICFEVLMDHRNPQFVVWCIVLLLQ